MSNDPAVDDRVAFNRAYKATGGRNGPLGAGYPPEVAAANGYGGGYGGYSGGYGYGGGVNASINLGHGSRVNVGAPLGAIIGILGGGHHNDGPPPYVPGYGNGSVGVPMRPTYRDDRDYGRDDRDYGRDDRDHGRRPLSPQAQAAIDDEQRIAARGDTSRPQLAPLGRAPIAQQHDDAPASPSAAAAAAAAAAANAPTHPTAPAPAGTPAPATAAPEAAAPDQKTLNQQAQLYLERMGLSTGNKNHQVGTTMAADADSAATRMDGLVGPKTNAALESLGLHAPINADTLKTLKEKSEQHTAQQVSQTTAAPSPATPAVVTAPATPNGDIVVTPHAQPAIFTSPLVQEPFIKTLPEITGLGHIPITGIHPLAATHGVPPASMIGTLNTDVIAPAPAHVITRTPPMGDIAAEPQAATSASPAAAALPLTKLNFVPPVQDIFGAHDFASSAAAPASAAPTLTPAVYNVPAPSASLQVSTANVSAPEGAQSGLPNMKAGSVQKISIA